MKTKLNLFPYIKVYKLANHVILTEKVAKLPSLRSRQNELCRRRN